MLIVSWKVFAFSPEVVVIDPLKKLVPFENGVHGEAKADCATECF